MRHHLFAEATSYPVALLIKGSSFAKHELVRNYVEPLQNLGVPQQQQIAFTLQYNEAGKAPASYIKEYLSRLLPALDKLGTQLLYVADGTYFKTLTGVTKSEPHHGYVLPCKIKGFEHLKVVLGINYQALIYNPDLQAKLDRSLETVAAVLQGSYQAPGSGIIHSAHYPESLDEIRAALAGLHLYPALTIDIEAFSLDFDKAGIGTIAMAWDQHHGIAFACDYETIPPHGGGAGQPWYGRQVLNAPVRALIKEFLTTYKGRVTWHNATYDVKVIIYNLWMNDLLDTPGLLDGLHLLCRNMDDSKIIAYLATNSTAGNVLGLKPLAHEFAGNWAQDDIKDIRKIPLDKLLQYNLVDCLSTWFVKTKYTPIMQADNQENLYHTLMLPSLKTIIQIELTGMPMNQAMVAKVKAKLEADRDVHLKVLNDSPTIKVLNLLVQDQAWTKDYEDRRAKAKNPGKILPKQRVVFDNISFNPNSGPQLIKLLYDQMGLPVIDVTDTKLPATGADTLEKLIHHTQVPEYIAIMEALIGYGKIAKILSAFIPAFEQAILKSDGFTYLHGSFNLGGTVSGRLSSCVAAWTRINTQRGLVPITELQIGDMVWTHNRRWRPVEDVILKPVTPMVDVQFCNGYILTCTKDHKLRLPDGTWKTVREIINERIEIVDAGPCEHFGRPGRIPQRPALDRGSDCYESGDHRTQHQSCAGEAHVCVGTQSPQGIALLDLERGRTQSDEGQNQGTAPQLDRGMLRLQGLPDHPAQWGEAVCPSSGDGRGFGFADVAGASGSASHRRGPSQQCVGQLGTGHTDGSREDPLTSGDVSFGKIETIYDRGDLPVWDITVAEDHSYWAEGCFNHNSDPNLQNIPAGSTYGKLIKLCFEAVTGWLFCGADFNSLEDYISALTTKDPAKLDVYLKGFDGHSLRAAYYFREDLLAEGIHIALDDPTSVNQLKKNDHPLRQESKAPTFALTYQGTWITLVRNLGWSEEKAKAIEANYHELYKVSDEYIAKRIAQAAQDGYVEVAFGLRVRTPLLGQTILGTRSTPYEAAAEGRTAGNAMGQSYGLLNNRAANAFMERVWASEFKYDVRPVALIHDAIYLLIRDDVRVVEWVNRELITAMQWQELPEIQHDQVKLGAALDIFWPNWSQAVTLPNGADQETIRAMCEAHITETKEAT